MDYGYDADNRLVRVTDSSGTTTYGYNLGSGNLITKTLPNGIYTTYTYDADGRLTDVANRRSNGSLISSYRYTLDANGNVLTPQQVSQLPPGCGLGFAAGAGYGAGYGSGYGGAGFRPWG